MIAQLVERRTVVGYHLISLGHRFDSGSREHWKFFGPILATKYFIILTNYQCLEFFIKNLFVFEGMLQYFKYLKILLSELYVLDRQGCIGGSVVECSPATRAARVRFPADASFNEVGLLSHQNTD